MTEEEFLMSLPQSLKPNEKLKRLEQWRQENPQPEVEEVVEEETLNNEAIEKENRINLLYEKYNPAASKPFMPTKQEEEAYNTALNVSVEEKAAWLDKNTRIDQSYSDVDTSEGFDAAADFLTFGLFDFDEEAERTEQMQKDKELQIFKFNQQNKDYLNAIENLSSNKNLNKKQKAEQLKKIQPPALVIEKEVEDVIVDVETEWRDNAVTWSTMDEADVRAQFDSDKAFNDYKRFMKLDDEINNLQSSLRGMTNKQGMPYGNMRTKYKNTLTQINELMSERGAIIKPYNEAKDKEADKIDSGLFSNRIKYRTQQEVSPSALAVAETYLPTDFSGITDENQLDEVMKESYREYVKNDEILKTAWDNIQKAAAVDIKKYQDEVLKTADLTTQEGVDEANAKVEQYAKSITLDKFEGSAAYKKRLTDLGTVMDRAMSQTSTAYKRSQDNFLNFTDMLRGGEEDYIPFNDTLANAIEALTKGTINIYQSGKKSLASIEAKGVRMSQRKIDEIDERVKSGEISKEEGERLKTEKRVDRGDFKSLMDNLMEDKEDVEKLFDSIAKTEEYIGLFNAADLSDGISFQDAIFTTFEALPQIGLAVGGTLTGNPVLAGLGTAAMFIQMYGDNYWSAYQEGILKEAKAKGIDLNAMDPEERRLFEINSLNEGKHANMATSAAFAAVMTAAEQLGANKILKKTEEALGLGTDGLVSFYKGSWKDSGEALLKGALRKGEAGLTEFATEWSQEVLGQVSTALQGGGNLNSYLDWGASLESGKAGGVVGVMIPFGTSVATQTAVEIRNISRDVAINFAPDSKYGKFSLEVEKFFDTAQTNLDNKLANNELTEQEYKEESQTLADTRNSSLKIDPLADKNIRTRQLDLMVERNKLMREIKSIDDADLTVEQQQRLDEVKKQLKDVVAEQKLYSTSGKIRKIIQDSGPKDADGNPMIEFRDVQTAEEAQEVADQLEKEGYTRAAASESHGVQMVNPKTGKEVLLINNEVASGKGDFIGNVNVGAHEFLHSVLKKTLDSNPKAAAEMKAEMDKYLQNINVEGLEADSEYAKNLTLYLEDPNSAEEALTLFADGLANGDIVLNEGAIQQFKDFLRRLMQSLGLKNIEFNTGPDVVNFLKDYNKSIEKGKLTKAQKKLLSKAATGDIITRESRRGIASSQTKKSLAREELPQATKDYMELDNEILQQGLNDAIQNKTDQQFPLAQAVVEKNWPLISKSLNINNEAEMNAAKEVVIDQILGQFEGSGQGKYGPRNTSALSGFSLEGGAQVSTYLAETIRTRKPEIDAAIADRTAGPGIDVSTVGDAVVETTEAADTAKLGKKPSETSGLDVETETKITEAVDKAYKGKDIKFAETRNIPKEVADIYAEEFGINPQTITDKTRNFQKTDSEGLTKAKQFLLKNAKDDFARLPKTKDDFGKGTFVPKNVKDALYTNDKLTGSLKDYIDLIRTKPEKPIYRDRVGQTIRGLLGLHIRNRILETAQPVQAKRVQQGAKFARARKKQFKVPSPDANGKNLIEDMVKNTTVKFTDSKGIEQTIKGPLNPKNNIHREFLQDFIENQAWKYVDISIFNAANLSNAGNRPDLISKYNQFFSGDQRKAIFSRAKSNMERARGTETKAQKEKSRKIRIAVGDKGTDFLKDMSTAKYKKKIEDNYDGVEFILNDFANMVKKVPGSALVAQALFFGQANSSGHMVRQFAMPIGASKSYINNEGRRVKEHVWPANSVAPLMMEAILNDTVSDLMPSIRNNYFQIGISKIQDNKLKDTSGEYGSIYNLTAEQVVEYNDALQDSLNNNNPSLLKSPLLRYFNNKVNNNRNGGLPGLNSNELIVNGKTVAETYTMQLPKSDQNADNIFYQNELTYLVLTGEIDQATAVSKLKTALSTNNAKASKARVNSEIANDILKPDMRAETQKRIMTNSLNTRVNASKINPEQKGISVFDFDDTLAKTKEKVIVEMPDGKTKEISASEFAQQADQLTQDGATFDFSNFDKVAKDTKEGPLADVARKRQGKFGSGDIFVLTARPQASATAIKQFLDGIGINIPLKNITGLEDGSSQAKVDWILNKTAEGYNDFYFADDSLANVKGVKAILDAVDVKNDVYQAKQSKARKLNKDFNKQLEEVTGKEAFKKYSDARARLEGQQKDKGLFKRFINQFKITPSADDFMGLLYAFAGKGEQGNKHLKFLKDNLIDPYNKAEQELLSAKVRVANDFAALKKQFPNLKSKKGKNPLLEEIGIGPYTKSHAVRVYNWAKQGLEIPGMSKRDVDALVKAVEQDNELNVFADELGLIQKGEKYPAPEANWLAGDIKTDILKGLDTTFRKKLMAEFNQNSDIIFSKENLNKIESIYGSKFREALEDSLRRMKSGSNRPVFVGSGARIVNEMMDWLNSSVGAVMFLNMRSGLLQMISNVNFINWGDNNIYKAAKAFASKDYFPTVLKLMNSDYLVNRRDGLKINVNEAELADAGRQGGIKGMINYILDKGFAITRIMDTLAIATGGATFFINRKAALQNRVNEKTGKLYTEAEAEQQAFDDFYAIAEETQQSSNPSKISQQQASFAGRIILSFQNVTMQYNRKTKKSIQDLYNRRKKPGMTQRESDLSNMSSIIYYVGMQNLLFQGLQQGLFALAFDDDEEDNEKEKANAADIINGMSDSLLFGLGFGGAIVSTVKNILIRVADEKEKKTTQYREIIWDVFNLSPVLDSKVRKLRTAAKTFDWNMKEIKRRGWSIDNPAYLAISQIISATTNLPIDRALQKLNNIRQATDEQTKTWQRVALFLGWSGWNFGLPYWGRQSTIDKEAKDLEKIKQKYKNDIRKFKNMGFTKKIPLSGPNAIKPTGELGVDYIQVERPDGTLQYYVKPKK